MKELFFGELPVVAIRSAHPEGARARVHARASRARRLAGIDIVVPVVPMGVSGGVNILHPGSDRMRPGVLT